MLYQAILVRQQEDGSFPEVKPGQRSNLTVPECTSVRAETIKMIRRHAAQFTKFNRRPAVVRIEVFTTETLHQPKPEKVLHVSPT